MSRITVLVAATSPDIQAGVISEAIAKRSDMTLVELRVGEIGAALASIPPRTPCALVLVGPQAETEAPAARWLAERSTLVVLQVNIPDDLVHVSLRDIGLDTLLATLRSLLDRAGAAPTDRMASLELAAAAGLGARPLLGAALDWIHQVLRAAAARHGAGNGLTVAAGAVQQALADKRLGQLPDAPGAVKAAHAELARALSAPGTQADPLAIAVRRLSLSELEFHVLLLALAAELDPLYQTAFGLLLDDASRRVGTLALCAALLGEPSQVRRQLAATGNLARWRVLDGGNAGLPAADEPLRIDPFLVRWLLGEHDGLAQDGRVRRGLHPARWRGAKLIELDLDRARAANLVALLQSSGPVQWLLFAGESASAWRALFELGADARQSSLIRVDAARLGGLEAAELEESALRLGRMALLGAQPLILDLSRVEAGEPQDEMLRQVLATLGSTGARSALICADAPRVVRLLGSAPFALTEGAALHAPGRTAVVRAAANALPVTLAEDSARAIAQQYPLQPDGVEHAMRLAQAAQLPGDSTARRLERFVAACKDVAAEGVTQFADRIDPVFALDDVVLPPEQKRQLREIVDSVRLTSKVLDDWNFREALPYGRGTTVLFHGPSGCGKTMSALAIANALGVGDGKKSGVPVLRVELSRLISKFIGDTPKHIDRVFEDARRSGAAILIDEADALLQRRATGPGLDSNDRHAAMEIAYLLQKIEGLDDKGLVILTTNLRQNIEPALLRRLRFIVEFPRPDATAREEIWRRCLPAGSHTLDDAAFRLLARKVEVAGGNIRQITLRAAFVAAAADSKIRLEHLVYASRAELAKLGLPAVALELPELKAA